MQCSQLCLCSMEKGWTEKKRVILAHSPAHKGCRLGLWSKNALMCIAPTEKHLFGAHFPSSLRGLTAIAFATPAGEQPRNVLSVPHSRDPLCLNERCRKEWKEKFRFPTFGPCRRASAPEKEGHLWSAWHVPSEGTGDSMVSPHHQ